VAEDFDGAHGAGRAVDPNRSHRERRHPVDQQCLFRVTVRRSLLGEREHRHDRRIGDPLDRLHRDLHLVQAEEGLQHQQVGAAAGQHGGLLGMGLGDAAAPLPRVEVKDARQRSHGARDEHRPAGHLPGLAGDLHGLGVAALGLISGPQPLQSRPGGAERGGLDQPGAGRDVALVHLAHRLRVIDAGQVQRRPLGQPTDELRAHGAVGDENTIGVEKGLRGFHGRGL
jgi:hypothetical protein